MLWGQPVFWLMFETSTVALSLIHENGAVSIHVCMQAKFGISAVAEYQMETYTTAVLMATLKPPSPAKFVKWRTIMDDLGKV